jgi:hypothetical protein
LHKKWTGFIPFFVALFLIGTLITTTTIQITDHIKLGLDLKGGFVDEKKVRELLTKPSNLSFKDPEGNTLLDGQDFVPDGAKLDYKDMHPVVIIQLKRDRKSVV